MASKIITPPPSTVDPLAVFAPCLLDSMALSLAAQHFQVAVHEILLVYSAVDGPPTGQVQLTGRTCDLLRRPRCTKLLVYVVDDLLGVEHPSVAVGAAQQVFLLSRVRVIGRDVVHVGTVSAYLTGHGTDVSADQPGDLAVTQPIHVIFPYTTAFFYGKMVVVHTVPSGGLVVWLLHSTTGAV